MSDIQASLSDPNRNVLAFIVSVRQLLENANTNKELDITSALRDLTDTRNYPVGSKTNCFTELWLERSIDTTLPNFKDKLQRQLQVLMQVCGTNLISPLVQMVHSYLRGERFHISMPVEVFDTQHPRARWRVAVIQKIESITATGDVFFYLNYVGWWRQFDEWILAQSHRIKLMHDKQGEIVHYCEFYSPTSLHLGQLVDYYDDSNSQVSGRDSDRWKRGIVSDILSEWVEVTNETQRMCCRCVTACRASFVFGHDHELKRIG